MTDFSRPMTTAKILSSVADFFDMSDQLLGRLATAAGQPWTNDKLVQNDLRMLSAWLREHPEVDRQMYSVLEGIDAG